MRDFNSSTDGYIPDFMRMPPEMLTRYCRITKQYTWYREPLELGLKLAVTLRHARHAHKVLEGVWIFTAHFYHQLVIQAELPPPLNPGSRPETSAADAVLFFISDEQWTCWAMSN